MHILLALLATCLLEKSDKWGPDGTVAVKVETVVRGLEVPWSFAFLPGGDVLISERPGRVRLLHNGKLEAKPVLTLTSQVSLKNYAVDLSASGKAPHASKQASKEELDHFLQPTRYVPTDGIVKETALKATAGATTDMEKARAIYDWVVDNTFRDPKIRGCGRGDIKFMLESGDMGGKCADLNALYVGLARSVGLPARHVYGLRIAKSDLGYKSLGLATDKATKGQHCRTEVYLRDHGWVPVDPADVRKVVLEEPPGNRPLSDEMVSKARTRLFGSWEMNWMAYNYAHDVALPGSAKQPVTYFMYPQAETADGRVDPFDPDNFKYEITVKEMS